MLMNAIVRRVARSASSQRVFAALTVQRAAAPAIVAVQQPRFFSDKADDSHSDFQPKYHAAKSTEKDEIIKMIESHVKTYPIMLYMKGTPSAPQCGFSMQVVRILHAQGISFDSVNVLDHPEIREGVKEYSYVASNWWKRSMY
ncbi:Monothiol glutaredoxin-S15 [Phytophthora citrophthora]|uniref:Monothiol glutaredoxin-S15 n=1 Tax=Phytophthora citrophthora TaxID=4793 RepID=A0AAD9GNP5_9STRA|nr:Monothiol glutaredoxin-S15 [Phytophthora citrophthora]